MRHFRRSASSRSVVEDLNAPWPAACPMAASFAREGGIVFTRASPKTEGTASELVGSKGSGQGSVFDSHLRFGRRGGSSGTGRNVTQRLAGSAPQANRCQNH